MIKTGLQMMYLTFCMISASYNFQACGYSDKNNYIYNQNSRTRKVLGNKDDKDTLLINHSLTYLSGDSTCTLTISYPELVLNNKTIAAKVNRELRLPQSTSIENLCEGQHTHYNYEVGIVSHYTLSILRIIEISDSTMTPPSHVNYQGLSFNLSNGALLRLEDVIEKKSQGDFLNLLSSQLSKHVRNSTYSMTSWSDLVYVFTPGGIDFFFTNPLQQDYIKVSLSVEQFKKFLNKKSELRLWQI